MRDKVTSIEPQLFEEIKKAISNKEYGSVEIYIESGKVVQITERGIKKTIHNRKKLKTIKNSY